MGFSDDYSSFKKKEKIYFTDENLAEFKDLVDSLKNQLILDVLSGYGSHRTVLTTDNVNYPNLFELFNKYDAVYTHSSTFRTLLIKELQTNLNDAEDTDTDTFKVDINLKRLSSVEKDNSITELVVEVIVKKEA